MAAIAVTPVGVRDGDPDALVGLCDRRGPAVLAYCEVVAGRGAAAIAAAAEAFASFRAGVVAAPDLANLNPEALLISATRHGAARHAGLDLPEPHARVPTLLAARADRSITLADHDWLEEHLASCWTCRAPIARFEAADRAYRDPPNTPLPPDAAEAIIGALLAAAPLAGVEVQPPAPGREVSSANGSGPQHAAPAAVAEPGAGDPQSEFDPAAVEGYVDQPTSAWQVGVDDIDVHVDEPASEEDAERSARRSARRAAGLGALGRKGKPRAGREPGLTRTPRDARSGRATAGGRAAPEDAAGETAEPTPASPTRRGRSARATPAGGAAPATRAGRGTSLPRPRRELSVAGSARRPRSPLRPGLVLPIALVVLAIFVALLIAGVFGGGEAESKPQSFAPDSSAPAAQDAPPIVVVPGAASASAAAVEKAKARARAAARREQAAKAAGTGSAAPDDSAATAAGSPTATPTPNTTPPPPPPPTASNVKAPKIDTGKGATGAEQVPTKKDTSTVPELAPPSESAVPPPG